MYNIIIADDHDITLHGLKVLIEDMENINIAGLAKSGTEVLELLKNNKVDLVLSDIEMPEIDGIELLKQINRKYPDTKVLACTMHINIWVLKKIIRNNISGIISKHSVLSDAETALNKVLNGEKFYSAEVQHILDLEEKPQKNISRYNKIKLTKREEEILKLIALEYSSGKIAEKLCISLSTIETHRKNMFLKFGVKNVAGLIRKAMEQEIIE